MLRGGEAVLAAVSGGADSVALLDALRELAPALGFTLHAVHVDHGLRAESAADAAFVSDLCRAWGIPLRVERLEIARPAPGGAWDGLEAEARRARYAAFRRVAAALGADRVATGHTADDQAETVVMRLLDGAGPRGLGGIAPLRGAYIRPLLETRRHLIEAHLVARGIGWRDDASNADPRFVRNRIRHDVLPFLVATWDAHAVEWLTRGAARARALEAALETEARAVLAALAHSVSGALVLPARALERLPGELAAEVLRAAAAEQGGGGALRAAGERALRRVLDGGRPRAARLGRVRCERSGPWVRVGAAPADPLRERAWQVPGEMALPELGTHLSARCFVRPAGWRPARAPDRAEFDADRIPAWLTVRARRAGDRFRPWGGPGERRLKTFFIDAGVPRWERSRIPLLEADGEIIWVAGLRRGRAAPITEDTRRILEVTLASPLAVPPGRE
jgi:tRNA(Ile)-lysidine synthase